MSVHDEFRSQIESWTDELLEPYLGALDARAPGQAGKEFNDPVWGTIALRPIEVLLFDSPVLQRLRYIRQLGVVHLVYPAANHSRLEHTLGVIHQIDRLVDSLNEHYDGSGAAIDEEQRALLRATALCHDVGHGVMSHVSENALQSFPGIRRLRASFADSIGVEDVPLAEIASYFVVGSPAFSRLLGKCRHLADDRNLPLQAISMMQKMVIGESVDNKVPLLHELISGPFDADKLDYMTRDAFMTGVPVVTDIPRLVQKVRALDVSLGDLPEKVGEQVKKGRPAYIMTGMSLSGGRTLDELMFGQVLLYDKLYRHQKVRAAEAMVASIFSQLAPIVDGGEAMLAYRLVDHQLLELDRPMVRRLVGKPLTRRHRRAAAVAETLCSQLKSRELFVRAYAFALDMPLDPYQSDAQHYDGLERVISDCDDIAMRRALVAQIATEVERICNALSDEKLKGYPDGVEPFIWLDPPSSPPDGDDEAHAWLVAEREEEREVLAFREGVAGASRWSDAYLLTRDIGYVFSAEDLGSAAYVATETVLRREYGIRTPRSMKTYAKRDPEVIDQLKIDLADVGYYAGLPFDIRPLPQRLRRADVSNRIAAVLKRLQGYEGPDGARVEKGLPLLGEERILNWLQQFPGELEDEPLCLLDELRLIGRENVRRALGAFVDATALQFQGASITPLGTAKDSSVITTYYAGDLAEVADLRVRSLADALAADERPLVFIDDFIGSGQQAVSILEAWMGATPTTDLQEERGTLSSAAREGLKSRELGFVFAAGMDQGKRCLTEALSRLGLQGQVFLPPDPVAPRAFAGRLTKSCAALKAECERIGSQLLQDQVAHHDEKWRLERALGYGNEAFLVTFPYNTPTQSLTCLWKAGTVDGVEWTPLLPRRPKV